MDEVVGEFLAEAAEFLDALERDLVAVDGGKDPASVVAETFRAFHTIKGTSAFLGFNHVKDVAHAAEDLLDAIRDGSREWTPPVTDLLLEVLDALRALAAEAGRTGKDGDNDHAGLVKRLRASVTPGCEKCSGGVCASACQVAGAEVDASGAGAGTAAAAETRAAAEAGAAADAEAAAKTEAPPGPAPLFQPKRAAPKLVRPAATPAVAAPPPPPPPPAAPPRAPRTEATAEAESTLRVPVPVLDRLMNLVGELVLARNQLLCHEAAREDARLTATSQRIHHLTAGLQESVMKARMQPIDNVFSRLPRVARDTAQACGKQVRLVTSGQETELDKTLLEAIKDPLIHVVRNSVDHGIEPAAARAAAGKPAEGTVAIRALQDGGQVVIEVEDDGGGVSLEKVRQKAVKLGLVTPEEAARLSERETVDLIFRPGFSTAEAVTSISGRGVGMDVVRTNVERIGGSVEMVSRPGRGSVCRIRVPLTLVIVPALIVASGKERYAVPQAALSELVRIGPERLSQMVVDLQGTTVLRLRGAILPLVDLARELRAGQAAGAADGALSAVVLQVQGRAFGLLVDDVADTEEIVVKPLSRQLQQLGVYSGATVRGDGRVALVLDVLGLARRAGVLAEGDARAGLAQEAAKNAQARRPFLVLRGKDDGRIAIPLGDVARLEEIAPERVERVGGVEAVQYRGAILPLVRLSAALTERRRRPRTAEGPAAERLQVVVQEWEGREVGLVVDSVLDVVEEEAALDRSRARPGVSGCAVIQGRITEVLDTAHVLGSQLAPAAEVTLGR